MIHKSKCKICNSPYRSLYEELRKKEFTLKQIKEIGEKHLHDVFSTVTLNNHFLKHTNLPPKRLKRISRTHTSKIISIPNGHKYYEPRCKVCTSPYRDLYEKLRVDGWKLKEILQQAHSLGDNLSLISLSRHLRNHVKDIEQQPKVEIPSEPIFSDNQATNFILQLFVKLDIPVIYTKDLEDYLKDYKEPTFLTKTTIYQMLHDMFKNVMPLYLSKFEDIFEPLWNEISTSDYLSLIHI